MRRIGLPYLLFSGVLAFVSTGPVRADYPEAKISVTWITDTDAVRGTAPPLGALRAKRIRVISMGDARTGDDPRVVGERVELNGQRVRLWTQDDISESAVTAVGDLLSGWGLDVVDGASDLVLGVGLESCTVVEDETYDAQVLLRVRLETADRRRVWQGQVAGTAQVSGRRQREYLYGEALSTALARSVANIVNSSGLQEALLNDHPPQDARRPAAFRASGTGSIVTGSVADLAPADAGSRAAVRYVYPAPAPGTAVIAQAPQGGTTLTQISGFSETPIKEAPKDAAAATPAPEPVSTAAIVAPKPVTSAKGSVSPQEFVNELMKLTQSGAGPDLVAAFAKQRTVAGEFTAEDVIAMHQAGLSEAVVRAALEKK